MAALLASSDLRLIAESIANVHPVSLVAAWTLNVLGNVVVAAGRTSGLARLAGQRLPMMRMVRLNIILRLYSITLPFVVSSTVRWARYRAWCGGTLSASLIVFEKLCDILVIAALGAAFLLMELRLLGAAGWPLLLIDLGILVAATVALVPFLWRRPIPVPGRWRRMAVVTRITEAERAFSLRRGKALSLAVALFVLQHALIVALQVVLAKAMGLGLSVEALVWMRAVVLVLMLAPVSIGGLGVREAAYVQLMGLYGVGAEQALAFSFILLAFQLLVAAIGGLLEFAESDLVSTPKTGGRR